MDRGVCQTTVHGVTKELDTIERLRNKNKQHIDTYFPSPGTEKYLLRKLCLLLSCFFSFGIDTDSYTGFLLVFIGSRKLPWQWSVLHPHHIFEHGVGAPHPISVIKIYESYWAQGLLLNQLWYTAS